MDWPQIARVILYVRDVPRICAFYESFFGMHPLPGATDGWVELASSSGCCTVALHKAAATEKNGAAMKLVFGVAHVRAFKSAKEKEDLKFGVVHEADGFEFSNAKDPAGNSIEVSSRGLKRRV